MKRNYIPAFVMLLAGFITCIFGLYNQYSAVQFSITLFIVLICFGVLGFLLKSLVCHFIPENRDQEPSGGEENPEESEENESMDEEAEDKTKEKKKAEK